MKKKILMLLLMVGFLFGVSGCTFDSDLDMVSYNVSKEADQFRVYRRITFVNLRTNEFLFSMTGYCAIETDSDNDLNVVCRIGEDSYQKHFLHLTTETTYVVEQLESSKVSKYHYEIVFKPESIIPVTIDVE